MLAAIGLVDSAVILIYFAVILCMGTFLSRRQNSTEEYFLGGRSMNWLIVGINSLSAVVTVDIYQRFFRTDGDDRPALWVAKLVTLLAGLLSVVMAYAMHFLHDEHRNLYEVMNKSTGGLPGTLGMIVLAAILLPRCGSATLLVGAAVSMTCGWLITFSAKLFGAQWGISFMWIIPAGCVSGLLVTAVLTLIFPASRQESP